MSKPKLTEIEKMLSCNKNFSLTESQYLRSTGLNIPNDPYYLTKKSAVSRLAKENGYIIKLTEKTIMFEKQN